MSATRLPREVAGLMATGAAHVVRHPMESAAYAVGLVRGAATAAMRMAAGESVAPSGAGAGGTTQEGRGAERVGLEPGERLAAEADEVPAAGREPGQPGEAFEHQPQASSRDNEHGGPGDDSDIDVKNWREDADGGRDVETPVGTTGAGEGFNPDTAETDLQQPDTEPLMDPSLTKAIRSESDTMRRSAQKDPDEVP